VTIDDSVSISSAPTLSSLVANVKKETNN
jgi:hypothetical protein